MDNAQLSSCDLVRVKLVSMVLGISLCVTQDVCTYQERMIVRGGGRASSFARFGDGRNNPPVIFLEMRTKLVVQFRAVVHRKLLYLVRYKYSARSTGVNWS